MGICVGIIGRNDHKTLNSTFEKVVSGAMQLFCLECTKTIESNETSFDGFIAFLDLISVMDLFKERTQKIFQTCLQFGHVALNQLYARSTSIAANHLQNLIFKKIAGDAKDIVSKLPSDAGYTQVTVNSCSLTVNLISRIETLQSVVDINNIDFEPFEEIRENLMIALKKKAANYEEIEISTIFLLNNYSYIQDNLPSHYPEGKELKDFFNNLKNSINVETNKYQKTIEKCMSYLSLPKDANKPNMDVRRNRNAVKDNYNRFNTEFKRLQELYSQCSIPSKTFLEKVEHLSGLLVRSYSDFYLYYRDFGFIDTKKCIIYSPQSLQGALREFFCRN